MGVWYNILASNIFFQYRDLRFTNYFWQSLWKLLVSYAIATSAYYPQANGQTERMNLTIGQIFHAKLLDISQEHWPDCVSITEMAINFTINVRISKAPFEVLYGESILLPVDFLLSRESSINHHAHTFARLTK